MTDMTHSLLLSLRVATVATTGTVVLGVALAYFLARTRWRGRELLDVALTLPLVLPPTVTGYYLVVLLGRRGLIGKWIYVATGWSIMFTWQAAALASFVVSLPLMVKASRAAIESVNETLVHASYTLGHSEFTTAVHVVLPLAKRGIVGGAVLCFARAMGEFGATLMLAGNIPGRTDTAPIAIYSLAGSGEWSQANQLVALFTAVSAACLFLAGRITRGAS
jgi:molybdate transport system permease protein